MSRIEQLKKTFLSIIPFLILGVRLTAPAMGEGMLAVPIQVDPDRVSVSEGVQTKPGCGVARAFDGAWANESVTGTQWVIMEITGDVWCRVDFEAPRQLFEIDLQNSRFPGAGRIRDIRIEFSSGQSLNFRMADSDARQTFAFEPETAGWVKISLLNRYGDSDAPDAFGLAEIGLYEPRATPAEGVHDLNADGVADMLAFRWMGHLTLFIADSGRLPWVTDLDRDWDGYFRAAFSVGSSPQATWNPERSNWGSYTLLVDMNGDGRFDDSRGGDFWYQIVDIDGDGDPDIERTDRYHPEPLDILIDKFFYDLDDDNRMNFIDWSGPHYADEQQYVGDAKYLQDTAGNGLFTLVFERWHDLYYPDLRPAWENPIAFYDLDDDGVTELVVRATDFHGGANGKLKELEVAFDIDNSATLERPQSLDLQVSWIGMQNQPFDYGHYVEDFPAMRGLPEADYLFGRRLDVRLQTERMWIPYFDAYKIGTGLDDLNWNSVFLLVDEDDDDVRWEEMFSPHEFMTEQSTIDKHTGYDDHLGDRWESDDDYLGQGKLYVGRFDGRIHLYHAERAEWTIDYRALFKGSLDRPQEAPAPPDGMLYSVIQYHDTDRNGFIDRIIYGERKVGKKDSLKVIREVNLLDFATPENPHPDVCELFDTKTSDAPSGRKVAGWDGGPVTGLQLEAYDRLSKLFLDIANTRWEDAVVLHRSAEEAGLLGAADRLPMPEEAMRVDPLDHAALVKLTDVRVSPSYKDVLHPETTWEKYRNAFFLGETVLADIIERVPESEHPRLNALYYSGQLAQLARELPALGGR